MYPIFIQTCFSPTTMWQHKLIVHNVYSLIQMPVPHILKLTDSPTTNIIINEFICIARYEWSNVMDIRQMGDHSRDIQSKQERLKQCMTAKCQYGTCMLVFIAMQWYVYIYICIVGLLGI